MNVEGLFDEYDDVEVDEDGVEPPQVHELERSPREEPRHRAYDPKDVATDREVKLEERKVPASGDQAAWEELAAPIERFIKSGPAPLQAIRKWAERQRPRMSTKLAEEAVFWLELRGRVENFKDWNGKKSYRSVGDRVAQAASVTRAPESTPPPPKASSTDWLTMAEAQELLGISDVAVIKAVKRGRLVSKRDGDARGCAHLISRESATAYLTARRGHGAGVRFHKSRVANKESNVAKDWISTSEAAELLGVSKRAVTKAIERGSIEARKGDHERAPLSIKRASVIAYRDAKDKTGDASTAEKPAKAPAKREPKKIAARVVRVAKSRPAVAAAPAGELADDVRAPLRNVERGWMSADAALGHLRALVAEA